MFVVILSPLPDSTHSPTLPHDHHRCFTLSSNLPLLPSPHSQQMSLLSISPGKQKQTRRNFPLAPTITLPTHLLLCLCALPSLLLLWKNYLCSYLWIRFHSFLPPQGYYSGTFLPLYWIIPLVSKQMLKYLPSWEENIPNPQSHNLFQQPFRLSATLSFTENSLKDFCIVISNSFPLPVLANPSQLDFHLHLPFTAPLKLLKRAPCCFGGKEPPKWLPCCWNQCHSQAST